MEGLWIATYAFLAEGWWITILTVIVVPIAIIFPFWLLEGFNVLYNDTQGKVGLKVFLFIPYILLTIFCTILGAVLAIITAYGAVSLLNSIRDWWHK